MRQRTHLIALSAIAIVAAAIVIALICPEDDDANGCGD